MSGLKIPSLFLLFFVAACGNSQPQKADEAPVSTEQPVSGKVKTILFFGDSLTAGYGLEDPSDAFPALIQEKIDSLKLPYKVVNAGLSGETTAGGNSRINWILKQPVDVFVLELGANDGLRGLPAAQTAENLQAIVDKVRSKYPEVKLVLAGMMVPPNMGAAYAARFQAVFPAIAEKNKMSYLPFLLKDVGGIRALNQGDGIHPTSEGHRIIAANLWTVLKDVLK